MMAGRLCFLEFSKVYNMNYFDKFGHLELLHILNLYTDLTYRPPVTNNVCEVLGVTLKSCSFCLHTLLLCTILLLKIYSYFLLSAFTDYSLSWKGTLCSVQFELKHYNCT